MKPDRLGQTILDAVAAGILPSNASRPVQDIRPWPVVLLTALGAWLAAGPLLIVVGAMLGDIALRGAGPYIVGTLALAGAVAMLRAPKLALFIEQLAIPALIVGGSLLGYALFRDLPNRWAAVAARWSWPRWCGPFPSPGCECCWEQPQRCW